MTKDQERLYRFISKKPRTLREISTFLKYKNFSDFYDGGNYPLLLDHDFWNNVSESHGDEPFEDTVVTLVSNNIAAEIESRRRGKLFQVFLVIVGAASAVIFEHLTEIIRFVASLFN